MNTPARPTFHLKTRTKKILAFPLWSFVESQNNMPLHGHEYVEVVFIIKGRGKHLTPFGSGELSPGGVLVIPKGGYHGYEEAEELKLINLMFEPDSLPLPLWDLHAHPGFRKTFMTDAEGFGQLGGYPQIQLNPADRKELLAYLQNLIDAEESPSPGKPCLMMGFLMVILCRLSDLFGMRKPGKLPGARNIDQAVRFLQKNFGSRIRLSQLAELAAMSENSLLRHFAAATGRSPMHYLAELRFNCAARLLYNTDLPVCEIAERSGFPDAAYFSRSFRKYADMTPLEYRRNSRNNTAVSTNRIEKNANTAIFPS